ncbi:hypothetical protein D3C71_1647960 [compost metagenome]
MGMSGSGKTSFIKKHFKDEFVLDLLDFQKRIWPDNVSPTTELVLQSYEELKSEMLNQLNNHDVIIVEHTLLKVQRREPYLSVLKDKNVKITGYFLDITEKAFNERHGHTFMYHGAKEIQELPTMEESFDELFVISQL